MPEEKYTAEFKTKIVLNIIQGEKEFNAICAEFNLNPNMVREWKEEFLRNAHLAFDSETENKIARKKENALKRKNDKMLKTIDQLTLERDFLQDCFRKVGEDIPRLPGYER